MKTIMRTRIYLPMAALIVTAALAVPAPAQQQVPFKGTFQGSDATTGLNIHQTATGMATQLGQFSLTMDVTINPANLTDAGSAQWIAANGDTISTTVAGFAIPGDIFTVWETHTVTGGTGRFSGVQGAFIVHRMHVVALSPDGTHVTFGSFEGTITPPGATR